MERIWKNLVPIGIHDWDWRLYGDIEHFLMRHLARGRTRVLVTIRDRASQVPAKSVAQAARLSADMTVIEHLQVEIRRGPESATLNVSLDPTGRTYGVVEVSSPQPIRAQGLAAELAKLVPSPSTPSVRPRHGLSLSTLGRTAKRLARNGWVIGIVSSIAGTAGFAALAN